MASRRVTSRDYHVGNASPAFVSNMRRLLQARAAKHYTHGHKTGALARSRMYRVGLPPIDGGDWNSRVFKRKTSETDLMSTAVSILVDWSGSMSGEKECHAAQAAGLINEAFGRVLRVPLKITAFSSSGPIPTLGIMKDWNDRVSADQMADSFAKFRAWMSGNNDADVLQWAYRDILARKEKRKVIIVLSDGSPADGYGDPYYALKSVTDDIQAKGLVDLYGIGIMDSSVKHFYAKNRVISRSSELEPALVEVMGRALK